MIRHRDSQHPKANEENDSDSDNEVNASDVDDEENYSDGDLVEETDINEDSEENYSDDDDEDDENFWEILKSKAVSALEKDREEDMDEDEEELVNEKASDEQDTDSDEKEVLNETVNKISDYYVSLLRLHHLLKSDSTHKKIMKTKKRLIEEEDFDELEALYSAAKQRKLSIADASGINLRSSVDMKFMD